MKVIVFDTKPYDRKYLDKENERYGFEIKYIEGKLTPDTAKLAAGYDVVCAFVNDDIGAATIDVQVTITSIFAMHLERFTSFECRSTRHLQSPSMPSRF